MFALQISQLMFVDFRSAVVILLSVLITHGHHCLAQQADAAHAVRYPVPTKVLEIRLVESNAGDSSNRETIRPILGAVVRPQGLRSLEQPGSFFFWPKANVGPAVPQESDVDGRVAISYPEKFGGPGDWTTASKLALEVSHAKHVSKNVEIDLNELAETFLIELERGAEASFSAMDSDGRPIDFGVMTSAVSLDATWAKENESKVCRSIPKGRYPAMLVAPAEDGQHQFSSVIPLDLSTRDAFRIQNVPLKKGIAFVGTISKEIPRPIEHGHVFLSVQLPFDLQGKDGTPIYWEEWAEIHPDGSFRVESIPSKGVVRVIALCRGWVIDSQRKEEQTTGIDFDIEDQHREKGEFALEIPMVPTGQLEVSVITPDGDPLPDAVVSTWPNQTHLSGGSEILGNVRSSASEIRWQLENKFPRDEEQLALDLPNRFVRRYSATTNEEGTTTLFDVPLNQVESLYVEHPRYGLPFDPKKQDRVVEYSIPTSGTKEFIVEVVALDETSEPR